MSMTRAGAAWRGRGDRESALDGLILPAPVSSSLTTATLEVRARNATTMGKTFDFNGTLQRGTLYP